MAPKIVADFTHLCVYLSSSRKSHRFQLTTPYPPTLHHDFISEHARYARKHHVTANSQSDGQSCISLAKFFQLHCINTRRVFLYSGSPLLRGEPVVAGGRPAPPPSEYVRLDAMYGSKYKENGK